MNFRNTLFAAVALCITASASFAQNFGIDFKSMPRGTKLHYESSQGPKWVGTYVGKKGKYHRIDVRFIPDEKKYRRSDFYNKDGYLVKSEYKKLSSQDVDYTPFHCARIVGKCTMSSTKGDGIVVGNRRMKLKTLYTYSTTLNGANFSSTITETTLKLDSKSLQMKPSVSKRTIKGTLTDYNLFQMRHWSRDGKKGWTKLLKIETK